MWLFTNGHLVDGNLYYGAPDTAISGAHFSIWGDHPIAAWIEYTDKLDQEYIVGGLSVDGEIGKGHCH